MAVLDILRMGHPTLRRPADPYPVDQIGAAAFRRLVEDLRDTMHAAGGIGLAAPQVNVSLQVAVIEIPDDGTRYGAFPGLGFAVYVNPAITVLEGDTAGYWEGCLSVPGMMGYVKRPQHIRVDYLDAAGVAQSLTATGFAATVFQHEFDHLHGTLYVDRLEDPRLFAFDEEFRQFHQGPEPDGVESSGGPASD